MKHIKDVKKMDKTYYKTAMENMSRNIEMEERIGYLMSEEKVFIGVQDKHRKL
jgi:hypothetical protein